jgi:hypothetical protein
VAGCDCWATSKKSPAVATLLLSMALAIVAGPTNLMHS